MLRGSLGGSIMSRFGASNLRWIRQWGPRGMLLWSSTVIKFKGLDGDETTDFAGSTLHLRNRACRLWAQEGGDQDSVRWPREAGWRFL